MNTSNETVMYTAGTITLYSFVYGSGTRKIESRYCYVEDIEETYKAMIADHQKKCRKKVFSYSMKFETY